jgi:hypothetical protein
MAKSPKKWALLAVAIVVFGGLGVVAGPGLKKRFFGPHVVNNALVGRSESQIVRSYDDPVCDWPGHEALGNSGTIDPPTKRPVALRTVVYHPRGLFHLEGGTLWVWYYQRGDEWICSGSCWFAGGVNF